MCEVPSSLSQAHLFDRGYGKQLYAYEIINGLHVFTSGWRIFVSLETYIQQIKVCNELTVKLSVHVVQ